VAGFRRDGRDQARPEIPGRPRQPGVGAQHEHHGDRGLTNGNLVPANLRRLQIMRRPFVAGNWKMNLTLATARELVAGLRARLPAGCPVEVGICPPAIYLLAMAEAINGTDIRLGAQNCYFESAGAYTGEVSPGMLKDAGVRYVIIGHSERRHTIGQGEDDAMLNRKLHAVLNAGLVPIFCIGEKIEQREADRTEQVLNEQLRLGLAKLSADQVTGVVIAYEPVWAIGTGRNATPEQAQAAHRFIRQTIGRDFSADAAQAVRIQYGGSVNAANAAAIMAQSDVDGALVGGASLKAAEFAGIIAAAIKAKGL
jgi:triosephosphate isomerase